MNKSALLFIFLWTFAFMRSVKSECIYEATRYFEGSSVPTAEPCLRCVCARSTLLCYLRICPELPDPPPSGCLILHRHRACCPELICADLPQGNRIEARYDPHIPDISINHDVVGHGCIHNGTLYGSGSAMQTSSLCEYCYCINGKEHCVKPKCLLPVEGCKALYAPHSCCPTHYKCRGDDHKTTRIPSTTITTPKINVDKKLGGCFVAGQQYLEGKKILGAGHSPCDNCYCMRGVVRCVPLSCAPPLLGCTPVVPPGECCAASYNCSGIIEVQPNLNYGPNPVVSKEYAQLRKEQQNIPVVNQNQQYTSTPHYILAESTNISSNYKYTPKPSTPYYFTTSTAEPSLVSSTLVPTSRQFFATTKHLPLGSHSTPESFSKYSKISLTTTRISGSNTSSNNNNIYHKNDNQNKNNSLRPIFKPSMQLQKTTQSLILSPVFKHQVTSTPQTLTYSSFISNNRNVETSTTKVFRYSNYVDIDFADDFLDGRNNRRIDELRTDITTLQNPETISTTEMSTDFTESTAPDTTLISTTIETEDLNSDTTSERMITTTVPSISLDSISRTELIGNSTDCSDSFKFELENRIDTALETTTENDLTISTLSTLDITDSTSSTLLDVDLDNPTTSYLAPSLKNEDINQSATIRPFKKIAPDIEAILNITKAINKKEDDYEYDYNEPSLPPSLPNLKIIPFVAADAVVEDKNLQPILIQEKHNSPTDNPLYRFTMNLFSPPIETEGGFVPRDPPAPILNNFYENNYHTTGIIDITSGTGTNIPAITNPPKLNDDCTVDGREVRHGELTSETGACSICLCLFGDIVCQPPKCSQIPPGCRRTQPPSAPPVCCGHIVCNGNEESPTVVLDRIEVTDSNPEDDPQSDPFRDVIRTEPAPNLQSLIGDIMPYLVRQTSTLKPTMHMTTPYKPPPTTELQIRTERPIKFQTTSELPLQTKNDEENDFSFDSVLKLLFASERYEETAKNVPQTTESIQNTAGDVLEGKIVLPSPSPSSHSNTFLVSNKINNDNYNKNSIEGSSSVGLLKLAGCNIYGRMYRVGRIISELSGPCLECMCTDIGVQCRPLKC